MSDRSSRTGPPDARRGRRWRSAGPRRVLVAAAGVLAAVGSAWAGSTVGVPLRSGDAQLEHPATIARGARLGGSGARRMIIRFDGAIDDARRERLRAAGVRLVQFVGDESYVARLRGGVDESSLADLGFVAGVGEFRASWKTPASFAARGFSSASRRDMASRGRALVQVHMFRDASQAEIDGAAEIIRARPGGVVYRTSIVDGNLVFAAETDLGGVAALAALDGVEFIEHAPEITDRNSTARGVVQSGVSGLTPLYSNGLTGLGEVVAVCDSGLDPNHCSFTNPPGRLLAFNGAPGATTHGTHVTAIAVGNGGGEATGHAYDANFVFSLEPAFTFTDLTSILELQASQTARVHTNSWGDDSTNEYTGLCRAIDAFMHSDEDQLVVFAVSNTSTLKSPENAKNCVSVAASQDWTNVDTFCSGGSGLTSDLRLKPDVFAPGCNINSAWAFTACGTGALTGTSMAAPAVAGVAALTREYFVNGYYPTGVASPGDGFTPSGALLKACLINSTTGMGGIPDLPAQQSQFDGWGRLVADNTLYFPADTRTLYVEDVRNASGLETDSVVERTFNVMGSGETLKVTLVWTDAPPAPGSSDAAVNDLDLELVAPDANTYLGNNFAGGESFSGGTRDTRNNVEQIHLSNPGVGAWTVRVRGTDVPEGPQGFALVVTGDVVAPARPLELTAMDPPSLVAPNDIEVTFDVEIRQNDDLLLGGTPMLHYRYAGPSFSSVALTALGGDLYRATLPSASCGHMPEFYVSAEGLQSGIVTSPPGAPAAFFSAMVGTTSESTIFAESFDGGALPAGWAGDGLWHVTSACERAPTCGSAPWAYFGSDAICGYGTGFREQGTMTAPMIALPALGPGERVTLRYCSSMDKENVTVFDRGLLKANGALLEEAPNTGGAWETREVDLSNFAGQQTTLVWRFDTLDSFQNAFGGWQVDDVAVVLTEVSCVEPCSGDVNGDHLVNIFDFGDLASGFAMMPNATRQSGDLDGDGDVDVFDFGLLASAFGTSCGDP